MEHSRFMTLIRDSITTLCRNALLADSVKDVQGLLGITLKTDEVLLINIQEEITSGMELQSPFKPPPSPQDITLMISPEPELPDPMPSYPQETSPTISSKVKVESPNNEMIFLSDEESDVEEKSLDFADSSLIPSSDIGKLLMELKADENTSPPGGGRHECPSENCVYSSKRRYNLLRHIRIMHQHLRIPCPQCSRLFNTKYTLKQHLDAAHNPRSCPVCALDLPNGDALELHKTTHDHG